MGFRESIESLGSSRRRSLKVVDEIRRKVALGEDVVDGLVDFETDGVGRVFLKSFVCCAVVEVIQAELLQFVCLHHDHLAAFVAPCNGDIFLIAQLNDGLLFRAGYVRSKCPWIKPFDESL